MQHSGIVTGRVSIVIPVYNAEEFLAESVASSLAQDYPDIEIIVADDGSTDGSLAVARRYSSRVCILELPHVGRCEARNRAIMAATGEFISLLDADDLYLPGRVGKLVAALNASPEAALAFCDVHFIDAAGRDLGPPRYPPLPYEPAALESLFYGCRFTTDGVLMRRDRVLQAGLFDQAFSDGAEDYDLWVRMRLRWPFVHVPEVLALYRMHGSNTSLTLGAEICMNDRIVVTRLMQQLPWARPQLAAHLLKLYSAEIGIWRTRGQWRLALARYGQALAQLRLVKPAHWPWFFLLLMMRLLLPPRVITLLKAWRSRMAISQ